MKKLRTTHDIRREFPELVARIERLAFELRDVIRDRANGYGTYNLRYAEEREEEAWGALGTLSREADEICEWLSPKEDT